MPARGRPSSRGDGRVPELPGQAPFGDQAIRDPGDPHLLARRGRGRDVEEMSGQTPSLGPALVRGPLDGRPPRGGVHRRQGEKHEQRQGRMNRDEQRDGDAQAQDPATRREQRHVHVIEHEDLVAQHRQPIEIVWTLVMGDGGDRGQERRHVRLERDGHLVAEPALHADADGGEEPCGGGRESQRQHPCPHAGPIARQDTLADQLEPDRQQGIGHGRQERQRKGGDDQRRLVAVAQLAQPPHRRERRGKHVNPGRVRRGRHSASLPRLRRRTAAPGGRTSSDSGDSAPSARRACRARPPCRARGRRSDRPGAPSRSGER